MGGAAAGKPSLGNNQIGGSGAGLGVMPGQGGGVPDMNNTMKGMGSGVPSGGGHNLGLPTIGGKETALGQVGVAGGIPPQLQQMLSGLFPSTSATGAPATSMQFGAPQGGQQFGAPQQGNVLPSSGSVNPQFGAPNLGGQQNGVHPLLGLLQQIFSGGSVPLNSGNNNATM